MSQKSKFIEIYRKYWGGDYRKNIKKINICQELIIIS